MVGVGPPAWFRHEGPLLARVVAAIWRMAAGAGSGAGKTPSRKVPRNLSAPRISRLVGICCLLHRELLG